MVCNRGVHIDSHGPLLKKVHRRRGHTDAVLCPLDHCYRLYKRLKKTGTGYRSVLAHATRKLFPYPRSAEARHARQGACALPWFPAEHPPHEPPRSPALAPTRREVRRSRGWLRSRHTPIAYGARTALLAAPRPHPHCGQRPHPSGVSQRPTGCGAATHPMAATPPHPLAAAATCTRAEPRHYQGKNL